MKSLTEAELRKLLEEAHRKGYDRAWEYFSPTIESAYLKPGDDWRNHELIEDIDKIMEQV